MKMDRVEASLRGGGGGMGTFSRYFASDCSHFTRWDEERILSSCNRLYSRPQGLEVVMKMGSSDRLFLVFFMVIILFFSFLCDNPVDASSQISETHL